MASAISASKNSWITSRTIGRKNSSSSPMIALISLRVLLVFFWIMVRYLVWLFITPNCLP